MSPNASDLDRQDPLAAFRGWFLVADDTIYLDGNSLGRMPLATKTRVEQVLNFEWGERLVRGWPEGWIDLPQRLGAKIARLVGAEAKEIVVCDSTSVNFFKLVVAALKARPGRSKIVSESTNFPSDLYLLQGCVDLLGGRHTLVNVDSPDGIHLPPELIEAELDESVALLTLTHTSFKSGYVHDMKRLTDAAHAVGALVIWDLSHSVGVMPFDLRECGVDLAVGCCYKYLNGGPGAPAFLYVRESLQAELVNPIWGWFGQRDPFEFGITYSPADGVARFLAGTPSILSMSAIEPGLDLLLEAGLESIRRKSVLQTEFLVTLWSEHLAPLEVSLNSPSVSGLRGGHVSFGHPEALRIDQALIQRHKVIPDFRRPNNLRFGASPLYNMFSELEQSVFRMREVIETGSYRDFADDFSGVS